MNILICGKKFQRKQHDSINGAFDLRIFKDNEILRSHYINIAAEDSVLLHIKQNLADSRNQRRDQGIPHREISHPLWHAGVGPVIWETI